MGFFSRLFGGGSKAPKAPKPQPMPTTEQLTEGAVNTVTPLAENAFGGTRGTAFDPQNTAQNPQATVTNVPTMADSIPTMGVGQGTTLNRNQYQGQPGAFSYNPATGQYTAAPQVIQPLAPATYDAATTQQQIAQNGQATAAQGELSQQAQVETQQIDAVGTATGVNEDGSINHLGQALKQSAQQNISRVIDTSTVAGKLLAAQLGEGEYTDAKATMQGQMELLSQQFVGPDGEPKIPSWAAGTARNVARIAAFKGMTGTAATAAMSTAIMEASLPMAQADAQFFQTLTVENLNNRQEATINRANVLAKIDLANLDARTTAAVENAKAFLQMDLANLDNEQQAEIVNTQARVQSILEDAKAENAARLFGAESENDFTKFYSQMEQQINLFNAEQKNAMERFNVGELNDSSEFNATLESQREQFYKEMQYNVDMANAKWRQTIETTNTAMKFQAAQTDVENMFGLSKEALNRLWDREDALFDYAFKYTDSEANRKVQIYSADRSAATAAAQTRAQGRRGIGAGLFSLGKIAASIAFPQFSPVIMGTGDLMGGSST